ncbi:saccharopine dehydrogenase NADP-binding domain-containing protein [uncultured Tolumonas sp.]|uniref:saccharopine dehydrogenase NADP-binding domain-containing protein n=1 Tax=uncultured Tolumonas sp. TaxID=263765 RepID=UPI00292E66C1|nr:saccharopine dehydrogenase NADP-binding domain-containing protein [uncultured Tolumonas sp.]
MNSLLIYGASGYTGRMAAGYAKAAGLNVIAAGRDPSKITRVATELGISSKVFSLDDEKVIDQALAGVSVILNCAGPYHRTAKALMHASLRTGCHYLDMAAELDSYQLAEQLDAEAKAVHLSNGDVLTFSFPEEGAIESFLTTHCMIVRLYQQLHGANQN